MATITREVDPVADAEREVSEATAALDALRAQHLDSGDVSAEAFSHAGSRVELAGLALQGARQAEADEKAAARLKVLEALRNEIGAVADRPAVLAAIQAAVAAEAEVIRQIGPARNAKLAALLARMKAAGVPETLQNQSPRQEDAGLGWQRATLTYGQPVIRVGDRAVGPIQIADVTDAIAVLACHAAGVHPGVVGASAVNNAIARDPAAWLERRV